MLRYRRSLGCRHRDGDGRLDRLRADRAGGQPCAPAAPRRVPAERVGRRDVGAAHDAVDEELDPRGLAGDSTRQSTRPVTTCPSATLWLRIRSVGAAAGFGFGAARLRPADETGSAASRRGRRPTWRPPPARACPASTRAAFQAKTNGARRSTARPRPSTRRRHRRGLRAPRAHAQLHGAAHPRPRRGRRRSSARTPCCRRRSSCGRCRSARGRRRRAPASTCAPFAEPGRVQPPASANGALPVDPDDAAVDRRTRPARMPPVVFARQGTMPRSGPAGTTASRSASGRARVAADEPEVVVPLPVRPGIGVVRWRRRGRRRAPGTSAWPMTCSRSIGISERRAIHAGQPRRRVVLRVGEAARAVREALVLDPDRLRVRPSSCPRARRCPRGGRAARSCRCARRRSATTRARAGSAASAPSPRRRPR